MLVLQVGEWTQIWRRGSHAHRQVEEQPSKRYKKNGDKNAVAMMKRNEQHQRTGRLVLDAYSLSTRRLFCVFQDMEPPKSSSILRKSSDMRKPIRRVKFTKSPSYVTLTFETKIHRLEWFAQVILISVTPMIQNLRIGIRKRRAMCPRSSGEASQKHRKIKGEKRNSILLTFGKKVPACAINHQTWWTRICCRFRSVDAHYQQSKKDLNSPEMDTLTKSCCPTIVINSQWRSADAWRGHSLCQRIEYILDNESPRRYASSFIAQKALAMKTDTLTSGSTVKNHISFKKGIRIQCNTENFVPIVVLGLSTSSSSSSHPSTSMAPSRQESHHPTSSSSSSSSPTTTVSSDSEIRDRGSKWNWFPSSACVKFKCWRDDRTVKPVVYCRFRYKPPSQPKSKNKCRGNHDRTGKPVVCRLRSSTVEFWNLGVAARIQRKSFSDERVPEHRDSHASSSHGVSSEPASKRSVDLGNHSAYTHFPKDRNCEICQRTKITRAPCRRRNGGAVPRAEIFGDLITADHKVLSEGRDSRNNHRYAIVVVQDLATQWIQSYPCKTKTSQETHKKELAKVLGAE